MNLYAIRSELAAEAGRYPTRRAALLWIVIKALDAVIAYDNMRFIQDHVERINPRREGRRA